MEYKHILLGTDGGDLMGPVYEHCAYLARLTDATVHAVYVLDAWFTAYPTDRDRSMENTYNTLFNKGKEIVATAQKELTAQGVAVDHVVTEVLDGSPAEKLVSYAEKHDVDVIVMGAHARKGLDRLIIGSVADKTIRGAKIPVFIVKSE